MELPQNRLIRYLDDARSAEEGIAEVLQDYVNEVRNEIARAIFEEHLIATKENALQLEKRLRELGGTPTASKAYFTKVMGMLGDTIHSSSDECDKATQDVVKAYATEHLEIGIFAALATYAEAHGDLETAELAEHFMVEQQVTAEKLRRCIPECAAETYRAAASQAVT
jgi:ferritin-like metal-binding protein YciE